MSLPALDTTAATDAPGPSARTRALGRPWWHDRLPALARRVAVVDDRPQLEVRSPLDDRLLGTVPAAQEEDVDAAVARARAAQPAWAQRPRWERAAILRRLSTLVRQRQGEALDLIQLESGKARAHAFEEVLDVAIVADYYARTAARHLRPARREGALPLLTSTRELRHPKGVVGFIAPWNYPLSMAVTDALPALVAGNTAVLKPAQQTPFTALWAVDLAIEAGLPADVLTVVTGQGSAVGGPLIDRVDYLTFTGSTEVGRRVAEQAGRRLIGCSLELGGKNALLVLDDADVDAAADGAVRGAFASAGQLCISIERILVHASVADDFTRRFVGRVAGLRPGVGLDWQADIGSLASQDQLDTVQRHVADAVAKGATVLTGGTPLPDVGPLVYAPTVLIGVTPNMDVYAEETFGPVVAISVFRDDDEAVAQANASRYGLNASVWTRDLRRGRRIATRLEAGTVNVNEAYAAAWASVDAPMGGFKESGLGRRHGREGIWKYTETQTVAAQRLLPVGRIPGLSGERAAAVLTPAVGLLGRRPRLRRS